MKLFLRAAALAVCASSAWAAQDVKVSDGGSYQIKISATELTRISVEGGRIEKAWAVNTAWETKADKENGELFIRPREGGKQAFSFIVRDSFGETFTLIALPLDIPSETVVLHPGSLKKPTTDRDSQPYVAQLTSFIRDMEAGTTEGYLVEELDEPVRLWDETDITLSRRYTGTSFVGEEYLLANRTDRDLPFSEQEFSGLGDNIKAIALERLRLKAHESQRFFIVRGL